MTSPAPPLPDRCIAFAGPVRVAEGGPDAVARALMARGGEDVLVFDAETGAPVEFDLRGDEDTVLARIAERRPAPEPEAARGPGRPRLGVVAREVTLLPRHWDWLAAQPGGASVALRRLVDEARRAAEGPDRARRGREAAYRFMAALAGNAPGFEEASRALFAGDADRFATETEAWPTDLRDHVRALAFPREA